MKYSTSSNIMIHIVLEAVNSFLRTGGIGRVLFIILLIGISGRTFSQQTDTTNKATQSLTLAQCIDYALQNQPTVKQSIINVSIAKTTNAINLSGWAPQVGASASLMHYFQLPTAIITANGQRDY